MSMQDMQLQIGFSPQMIIINEQSILVHLVKTQLPGRGDMYSFVKASF